VQQRNLIRVENSACRVTIQDVLYIHLFQSTSNDHWSCLIYAVGPTVHSTRQDFCSKLYTS